MKIWNFKNKDVEDGVEPPGCNGIGGGDYEPVFINYKKQGEIGIVSIKDKDNERKIN